MEKSLECYDRVHLNLTRNLNTDRLVQNCTPRSPARLQCVAQIIVRSCLGWEYSVFEKSGPGSKFLIAIGNIVTNNTSYEFMQLCIRPNGYQIHLIVMG